MRGTVKSSKYEVIRASGTNAHVPHPGASNPKLELSCNLQTPTSLESHLKDTFTAIMDLVAGVRKEGSRYVMFLILLYRPQCID